MNIIINIIFKQVGIADDDIKTILDVADIQLICMQKVIIKDDI